MAARVVKGMPSVALDKETFAERIKVRFYDPEFDKTGKEIDALIEIAWNTYREYHKSPRTRKAGQGFANPEHELAIEWLETRARIKTAELSHADAAAAPRILIINGSSRSDLICPGEMSKTYRLA